MRVLLSVLLLGLSVAVQASHYSALMKTEWEEFKLTHNKKYLNLVEETQRLQTFVENKQRIAEHNKLFAQGLATFKMEMNQFGDMKREEFVKTMNGYKGRGNSKGQIQPSNSTGPDDVPLPDTVDWRTKGAVTPVKDQGNCASDWAFSATGSLEGQHYLETGKLVSLSEQNLIDCSSLFVDQGCDGGNVQEAFIYVILNGGIDTESSYPYTAKESNSCKFANGAVGFDVSAFVEVKTSDEKALRKAVATVGPISVSIDASLGSFMFYKSGIYSDPDCQNDTNSLDHSVLAVGYGSEDGIDYWLVKNSWGVSWADKGYVKMARNKGNMCGIATDASYPFVETFSYSSVVPNMWPAAVGQMKRF